MRRMYICSTPVVYIFFNRPNVMVNSLAAIAKVRPTRMYFVADGPRNKDEKEVTDLCRQIVDKNVTWTCDIVKIYSEYNMGCCNRIYSGLSEVFKKEEKAIVLEDDIIPGVSFFRFQECMLTKYQEDKSVFSISAYNRFSQYNIYEGDYCFVNNFDCWGWGTWARSWKQVDFEMKSMHDKRRHFWDIKIYRNIDKKMGFLRYYLYYKTFLGIIDSWAYRVSFDVSEKDLLCVMPKVSLVKNIGFGEGALHTNNIDIQDRQVEIQELETERIVTEDKKGNSSWMKLQVAYETKDFGVKILKMILKDIINYPFRVMGRELTIDKDQTIKMRKFVYRKLKPIYVEDNDII